MWLAVREPWGGGQETRSGGHWQAGHSKPLAFTNMGTGDDGLFPCTSSLLCKGLLFFLLDHNAYGP